MGHLGLGKEEVYRALAQRLDRNPVGAPFNETLIKILLIMYSEKEARIGSAFPQGFVPLEKLARLTGLPEEELVTHLESMATKGLVIDVPRGDNTYYMLTPLVIGFFEYTFMRVNDSLPMQELAQLFEQYHHERGVAEEFFGAETKMFQAMAYESQMPLEVTTEVLTFEKASEMIRDAGYGALTMCYCRHQQSHLGKACNAPIEDVCTSLGRAADWLIRRGFARRASVDELLRVLEKTEKLGLVHLADNVQNNPAYICHCCGCCCGVLRSINEHGVASVQPSNFLPQVDTDACVACGICAESCHIKAISVEEVAEVNTERCIGCGVCVSRCPASAMLLVRKQEILLPPRDKKEQMLRIAREKGKIE